MWEYDRSTLLIILPFILLLIVFFILLSKRVCTQSSHEWSLHGTDWPYKDNDIPSDVSVRHIYKCKRCCSRYHVDHFINEKRCGICNIIVPDLQKHCESMNDKEHLVLSVHDL